MSRAGTPVGQEPVYAGRTVLGRQPATLWITPSKATPWYGTIVEGHDLTVQQQGAMDDLRLPASTETMEVVRQATDREYWWGAGQLAPVFVFRCPVLRRRRDGKVQVIAPDGMPKWVRADGWASPPSGRKLAW